MLSEIILGSWIGLDENYDMSQSALDTETDDVWLAVSSVYIFWGGASVGRA